MQHIGIPVHMDRLPCKTNQPFTTSVPLQSAASPPSLESYRSYLGHVKKTKEDPMFINSLYQRAVADHCLDVELWKDYLTYLVSAGLVE